MKKILILVAVAVMLLIAGCTGREKEKQIQPLIDNISQYASMTGEVAAGKPQTPMKVFIIQNEIDDWSHTDTGKYICSPIYFDLPEELKAKTPEELNTLIKLKYYYVLIQGRGKIYDAQVDITVIDIASGKIIDKEHQKCYLKYIVEDNGEMYQLLPEDVVKIYVEKRIGED